MMNPLMRGATALTAVAVGTVAYGSLIERNNFVLRTYEVPVLPLGAPELRVLHLSDIHLMPRQQRKQQWLAELADLEPDLVIDTGDHISHADSIPLLLDVLEPLLYRPGAFVLGANDYFAPAARNPMRYVLKSEPTPTSERLPTEELILGLGEFGWRDLSNARSRLSVKGLEIALVGVDDPHLKYDKFAQIAADDEDLPTPDVRLGVMHAPYTRVLDEMTGDGADMMFAGHTHGGQLALPGVGAFVTNSDLDTDRVRGVSRWWTGAGAGREPGADTKTAWLHVSAGLGTSPFVPIRIGARPEASLITLVPRSE